MGDAQRFDDLSDELARAVREHPELVGLALMGSASEAGRHRRDEWSDHDFFAIAADGAGPRVRADLSWLPRQEHIVLALPEGGAGVVALYDDGHLLEFAAAHTAELEGALAGLTTVTVDDAAGTVATLIAESQARAAATTAIDPTLEAGLALIKLRIGVGRARRGEVVSGGLFVRTWALQHLVRALRGRLLDPNEPQRDLLEPTRRLEQVLPRQAAALAAALEQPVEPAARALYGLMRDELESGWPEFPSRAADVIARRFGW